MKQPCEGSRKRARPKSGQVRLGLGLIAFSWLLWIPLPILVFLDHSDIGSRRIAVALLASSQVIFWIGVTRLGPRARRVFRGWRSRRLGEARHHHPAAEA